MWNNPTYRRLSWALLLSLLLHLAVVGPVAWRLPTEMPSASPIQVELVTLPPPKPAAVVKPPVPRPQKASKPKPPPPTVEPAPAPAPPPVLAPEPEPTKPMAALPDEAPAPVVAVPEATPPPAAPPLPAAPAVPAEWAETEAVASDDEPAMQPLRVEIDYRVLYKGDAVGEERQRYEVRADGSYTLSSIASPSGVLSLVVSELRQQSEGFVTERGLRPSVFLYQYGNKTERTQKAVFDWQKARLWLQNGRRVQTVDMPEGTQDLMSFMYQFMFVPPLQQMSLAITNGKRLKIYTYAFEGEETLATPMGDLRCIHILRQSGGDDEKTELWLAADHHFLPVKIRITEKDNKVTERNAVRLQLDDETYAQ